MGKVVNAITFVISIVAFGMCAIGYGAPWWYEDDIAGVTSFGLFQTCTKIDDKWNCNLIGTDSPLWQPEHKATLAMMTIGMAASIGVLVLFGMSLCGDKSVKAAAGASLGAGVFILIAAVVFGAYTEDVDLLGWAYWMAAIGGAGQLANGIITFILDCISCC